MKYGLKFCSCRMCRAGRGKGNYGGFIIRAANRKFRKQAKQALHKRDYDRVEFAISVPYTD